MYTIEDKDGNPLNLIIGKEYKLFSGTRKIHSIAKFLGKTNNNPAINSYKFEKKYNKEIVFLSVTSNQPNFRHNFYKISRLDGSIICRIKVRK